MYTYIIIIIMFKTIIYNLEYSYIGINILVYLVYYQNYNYGIINLQLTIYTFINLLKI